MISPSHGQRQPPEVHFLYWGRLFPVDDGYKSTAFHLIKELAKICPLRTYDLHWQPQTSCMDVEPNRWFTEQGIPHTVVGLEQPWISCKLRQPLYRAVSLVLGVPNSWWNTLHKSGVGEGGARVLCFLGGWNPIPTVVGPKVNGAVFMPADSISLFEGNRHGGGIIDLLKKWFSVILARAVERKVLNSGFSSVIYVSSRDADTAAALASGKAVNICTVPIGIDPSDFEPYTVERKNDGGEFPILLFSGSLDYLPNLDAAHYLVKEILPRLQTPKVKVLLVGKNGNSLANLASETVVVRGWVPVLAEVQHSATLFISAVRMGAGAKNNVLQALACGTPVVGTPQSFSGFPSLPPGAFTCTRPQEFSDMIDALLRDREQVRSCGKLAREYVLERFTWERTACRLAEILGVRRVLEKEESV